MSKKALDFALVGRFDRKLDATRRVRLPAEWFSLMGNPKSVVVLRDPAEKCLNLVSESVYEAQIKSLRRRSSKDAEAREELRLLEGAVEHVAVNARHCIRISDKLLSSAGIKARVAFLGCVRYAKLWDPRLLSKAEADSEAELAPELAALLADNGL